MTLLTTASTAQGGSSIERAARALRDEIAAPHGNGEWVLDEGFREEAYFVEAARAVIAAIRDPIIDALKPFADCAEELDGNEDVPRAPDGEWAKFRLLTDDYRRAREAVTMIDALLEEGK